MLPDDATATCSEQSHEVTKHGWNASYNDASLKEGVPMRQQLEEV